MEYTLNSNSLLESAFQDRFKGAPWFYTVANMTCLIGGAGGIGSWLCLLLAKTGVREINITDPDKIEGHNLGGQLYYADDLGRNKARSIQKLCTDLGAYGINSYTYKIQQLPVNHSTAWFACFDNMEAREYLFSTFLSTERSHQLDSVFIDGRLTADEFQVFCVPIWDKYSISKYKEEYLFSDEEATPSICTFRQTAYMAAMIGSVMVNTFIRSAEAISNPDLRTCLPLKISYNSNTMEFKTEV